jgi:hypothetical protein
MNTAMRGIRAKYMTAARSRTSSDNSATIIASPIINAIRINSIIATGIAITIATIINAMI